MCVPMSKNALVDEFTSCLEEDEPHHIYQALSVDSAPSELLLHLNHLRGRLDRRNVVLDAIRKAYHRDVIVIKEHLYRTHGQDSLPSVPSVDLRPALKLFAPQECELRLKPCSTCGGQLEIVHRDSARIQRLRQTCQDFQALEQDLRLKLIETERRAQIDQQELAKVRARVEEDRGIFIDKINKLKRWIVGYDNARKECEEMRAVVARLESQNEGYRQSLSILEETQTRLTATTIDLEEHRMLAEKNAVIIEELSISERQYRESESVSKSDCHTLSSSVWLLRGELADSNDRCHHLSADLYDCKAQLVDTKERLDEASCRILDLDASIISARDEHNRIQEDLLARQESMDQTIHCLQDDNKSKDETIRTFRSNVQDSTHALQRIRRREGCVALSDITSSANNGNPKFGIIEILNKEISALHFKVDSLMNFASGYARCVYDQCISQEALLKSQGYDLQPGGRSGNARAGTCSTQAKEYEGRVGVIMNCLDEGDETGNNVDWDSVLDDELDRRQILAQLSNRMQIGVYSLSKAAEKQRQKNHAHMQQLSREHDCRLGKLVNKHTQEMDSLRQELDVMSAKYEQSQTSLESSVAQFKATSNELESSRQTMAELKERHDEAQGRVSGLEDELRAIEDTNSKLETINSQQEDIITRQKAHLNHRDEDIQSRDCIIAQLERLLEKTTTNYAAIMEKERHRLATNRSVSIQAEPQVAAASYQTDLYIPPKLRRRPLRKDENGDYIFSRVETDRIPYHLRVGGLEQISMPP